MKRDRLMIVDGEGVFRLQWYIADDDDMGATLGEGFLTIAAIGKKLLDPTLPISEREHFIATITAAKCVLVEIAHKGYGWHTQRDAAAVLRAIKLAIAADKHVARLLPAWAVTAMAAGWKPPKG